LIRPHLLAFVNMIERPQRLKLIVKHLNYTHPRK